MAGTPAEVDARRCIPSIQIGPGGQDRENSISHRRVDVQNSETLESAACTASNWDLQIVQRSGF